MNAPLIQWVKEPGLWDSFKKEQDNIDYNKKPNISFDQTKEDLKMLWSDFDISKNIIKEGQFNNEKAENPDDVLLWLNSDDWMTPEEIEQDIEDNNLVASEDEITKEHNAYVDNMEWTWTEEEYKKNTASQKIKSTNEFPLVQTFLEERSIAVENLSLNDEWKISVNSIEWLSSVDKEMLTGLFVNIEWENRAQNITNFWDNIKELQEFEDFDLSIGDEWFENSVLNRIGANYISIPNKDWNVDTRKNVSTAIEIAKNEIVNEAKNIRPESQTYITAMANIEWWNLKQQLEWINSLYYLAFSWEWKLWSKDSLKVHKNKRTKELINDAKELEIQIQVALDKGDNEKFLKLDKQKDIIISEADELVKWDIFASWELDTMVEQSEKERQV